MIRVTIDFIPYGDESRAEELGHIEIINDGTGTQEVGNYFVRINGADLAIGSHERAGGWLPLVEQAVRSAAAPGGAD